MGLTARNLVFSYKERSAPILSDFAFTLGNGEVVALLGRNGCGKTTLLRLLAGLVGPTVDSSTDKKSIVEISGATGTTTPVDHSSWKEVLPRHVTMVFQDVGSVVFEWQTVEKALTWVRPQKDEFYATITACFSAISMPADFRTYWGQLSGGQKQAVALARGMLRNSDVLLLDEPFASVDASFRYALEEDLLKIRVAQGKAASSVLLVTHDIDEAVFLADRVVLVSGPPLSVVKEVSVKTPTKERTRTFRISKEFVEKRNEVFSAFFELPTARRL